MKCNTKVLKLLFSGLKGKWRETGLDPDPIPILGSIFPAIKIIIDMVPEFAEWEEKWRKAKPKDRDIYLPLIMTLVGIKGELERTERNNLRIGIMTAKLANPDLSEEQIKQRIMEARDVAIKIEKFFLRWQPIHKFERGPEGVGFGERQS